MAGLERKRRSLVFGKGMVILPRLLTTEAAESTEGTFDSFFFCLPAPVSCLR